MKFHQLEALIALVDQGSIRGAARALNITQPALSARITELEQELSATLVVRTARGTTLTDVGRTLLAHARTITNQVRRAEADIDQVLSRGVVSISVGASPLAAVELVAPLLTTLKAAAPGVHLKVTEGQFHELAPSMRDGETEFVIAQIPPGGKHTRAFHFEELITYPLHVVARIGHPMAHCRALADLSEAAWVVGAATSANRSTVEEIFSDHGLDTPRVELHSDAITLVLASIAQSDLIGVLVPPLYADWHDRISPLPISEAIKPLRLGLITLAGMPLSPAAQLFVRLIRERARNIAKVMASDRVRKR